MFLVRESLHVEGFGCFYFGVSSYHISMLILRFCRLLFSFVSFAGVVGDWLSVGLFGFFVFRISKKDTEPNGTIKHINVNACLMPVLAADGCHVTTVEGIGSVKGDNLHPIQKAMTEMHGSQCGK